jgi:hypothetical protein
MRKLDLSAPTSLWSFLYSFACWLQTELFSNAQWIWCVVASPWCKFLNFFSCFLNGPLSVVFASERWMMKVSNRAPITSLFGCKVWRAAIVFHWQQVRYPPCCRLAGCILQCSNKIGNRINFDLLLYRLEREKNKASAHRHVRRSRNVLLSTQHFLGCSHDRIILAKSD